jgi:hypothetical protein
LIGEDDRDVDLLAVQAGAATAGGDLDLAVMEGIAEFGK